MRMLNENYILENNSEIIKGFSFDDKYMILRSLKITIINFFTN